jgi:hypothetical protein
LTFLLLSKSTNCLTIQEDRLDMIRYLNKVLIPGYCHSSLEYRVRIYGLVHLDICIMMLVSEKNLQNIHCIFMLPIMRRLFQCQSVVFFDSEDF